MTTGLALFVYKRPEHTRKVIESIRKNNFHKIYVFQDGLRDEKDRKKWEEVSKLIKSITFAETEIHISEHFPHTKSAFHAIVYKMIINGLSILINSRNY